MINKINNVNLQLTISKEDNAKLLTIQEELKGLLNIDLSKSQVIAFLIRNYGKNQLKSVDINRQTTNQKDINYQAQIIALKDKLNKSYSQIAELIGISESTLKKIAYGKQAPKEENRLKLDKALIKYGIK